MLRGALANPEYRPQFSGHETFPLRHLWLRKAYDAVQHYAPEFAPRTIFTDPKSIIDFGVGKNMVSAIRHWAIACEVIQESTKGYVATELGHFLYGPEGFDPYLEHPASAWLIHWMVAGRATRTTTWYWALNYFPSQSFEREQLAAPIMEFCQTSGRNRVSPATIKRDVECFIRSYVPRAGSESTEELTEPVLGELGLVHAVGSRLFEFRRGPKPTLPDGIFLLALIDFWQIHAPGTSTLAFEAITYEPGSPGRVFKLDEDSVGERLVDLDRMTHGILRWSDTAGLRQVIRGKEQPSLMACLTLAYGRGQVRRKLAL